MSDPRQVGYPAPDHAPRLAAATGATPTPLHFWAPGPQDVVPVKPFAVKGQRYQWKFYWFLDRVEGTSRSQAARAIYAVLRNPRSWERTGVRWVRTFDRAKANIVVRVIPMDTTVCGKGAAGCYSSGNEADGKPVAEMGVEFLADPMAFGIITGMELCGHALRAADMYTPQHQPYEGVLGTWAQARAVGGVPTDAEIAAVKQWLAGQTPAEYVHDD